MKDKLMKIINHYGERPQLKQLNSEVFELTEAIVEGEQNHITEELADCYVMLKQFELYFDIKPEDIERIMEQKVDRQLKRIKEE